MCGIVGRFNFKSGRPADEPTLAAMCRLIAHRGPDGQGVWTHGPVGFGHRRLSIIDLSTAGTQPMSTPDGRLTVTFNGEIYNFEALRQELERRGHQFVSRSDTEVILHAYDAFGVDCLSHLHGMFAFALWDARDRTLFAARDRAGKKPFYYREDADGFSFASEPKAFLAEPSFQPEADPAALFQYLSYQYVPTPASAFKGVHRLPPAHYLLVRDGKVSTERYWQLRYSPKQTLSEADAEERTLDLLREATRARLVSDVPLGAFLSGGLDSSLIVALMSEVGTGTVKTFSIGFDESEYNELPYARMVAERFGTEHHEMIVRPDALSILPTLIWHYNEPYADSSAIPSLYLAAMTRKHVTVALNGDAGDENFAGYSRYLASLAAHRVDWVPRPLRQAVARMGAGPVSRTLAGKVRRFLQTAADTPEQRYARWVFHFVDRQKRELCTPGFLESVGSLASFTHLESLFAEVSDEHLLDATLHVDVHSYLPDDLLVKVDIATMTYGLEGRSPFLDHRFMEHAASLPTSLKIRGLDKKYLLKKIARRYLPSEVIDRPKMGFGVPLDHWFRTDLRELAHDTLLGSRATSRGYFRPEFIRRMLAEHEQGRHNWAYQLWNVLVFELWHQMFIDARPSGPPAPLTTGVAV